MPLNQMKMKLFLLFLMQLISLVILVPRAPAENEEPVRIVADSLVSIKTSRGVADMPVDISIDWNQPQPLVSRAVIVFHGKSRDVDGYFKALLLAADLASSDAKRTSVLIAPQFLNEEDARAHHLSNGILRWRQGTWEAGSDASAPLQVSSYEVIDALISHLANPALFPNLKTIVLAGHSGGGQAIQRYAIVGRAESIAAPRIQIRYVVANPSSYMYFSDERPKFDGQLFQFEKSNGSNCKNFNHWKYGPLNAREEYVRHTSLVGWQPLEDAFSMKDVIYLLGTADVDTHEKDLDVTCAGEMEGPNRFLRGQAYYAWLHERHPTKWSQRMWLVPGVAHSGSKMFTSECGVDAIFGEASCSDH